MTNTSRAIVFTAPGQPLECTRFATPAPSDRELLVGVAACTLCGSDLHSLEGRRTVPLPTILGHEIIGRIEAFGPGAARVDAAGQPLRVGDRITWSVCASCGECFFCRRDLPQKCETLRKYGHAAVCPEWELSGGLAEHCLVLPGTAIMRLPDALPVAAACPAGCATATVAAALEAAGDLKDAAVLVVGAGMLGVTACAMARHRGAREVICFDPVTRRRELARRFGATEVAEPGDDSTDVVAARTAGRGADIVLEMAGNPAAFEFVLPRVRTGGTLVLVGSVFPSRPVPLALEQVVRKNLVLRGVHNYQPRHLRVAVEFLAATAALPWDTLVSRWITLDEVPEQWTAARDPDCLRLGVRIADD